MGGLIMVINPFEYSKPIAYPDKFFGRQEELNRIKQSCLHLRSISIVGERRSGKTSLLKLFSIPGVIQEFGFGEDFIFCYIDAEGLEDIEVKDFWENVLSKLGKNLQSESLKKEIKKIIEREAYDNFSLRDLFEKLGTVKIVFLFDEFETILQNPKFSRSFYGHLRYLTQNCSVAFITASRRELVYHCVDDDTKSSPFFNVFENLVIKPFDELECRELVKKYLSGLEISFTDKEINKMVELSGGYAAFFQIACHFMFYAYQLETIKENQAERMDYVEDQFRIQVKPHFVYFWNKSEEEELILLALLAFLSRKGKNNIPEEKIKKIYPRYRNDLLTLVGRSLVLKDNGNYRIFSPVFVEWILIELTDISQKEKVSFEEWLSKYKKSLIAKGIKQVETEFKKVNPKYWDLLRKTLMLVKDPRPVIEVMEKIGHIL
jgi:hypothetical protein